MQLGCMGVDSDINLRYIKVRAWILLPFVVNLAAVIIFIPELNYRH